MSESDEDTNTKSTMPSKSKTRLHGALIMQSELLKDLETSFSELKAMVESEEVTKFWLQAQQKAADAEFETANKYNKAILTSSSITEKEVQSYSDKQTFKKIKDLYWKHIEIITEQLAKFEVPLKTTSKANTIIGSGDAVSNFHL